MKTDPASLAKRTEAEKEAMRAAKRKPREPEVTLEQYREQIRDVIRKYGLPTKEL